MCAFGDVCKCICGFVFMHVSVCVCKCVCLGMCLWLMRVCDEERASEMLWYLPFAGVLGKRKTERKAYRMAHCPG